MSSGISGEFEPMRYSVILIAVTCAILDRRAKERLDRGERLERVMDQDVLVANLVEDHLGVFVVAPQAVRRERRVLQLRTMKPRELRPVAEPETILRSQDDLVADLEVLGEDVEDARRHAGLDVQQRDRAAPELPQAAIDALEQVVGFVLFDLEIRVADDAEQIRALDLRAREELLDVGANDVLDEDEVVPPCRTDRLRQRDEARQRHPAPSPARTSCGRRAARRPRSSCSDSK